MDFSKLSEETMELSTQIGPRQQKLLFDTDFYEDEVTLNTMESVINHDNESLTHGPGIVFFVDIGSGSFCVRGLPVIENNLSLTDLIRLDKHFEKATKTSFFPCETIEVAEMISEQMINRRYPLQDNGLLNISDPGPTWLISYDEKNISLFFKSMGTHEKGLENIGAIGDAQIFRFWWKKIETLLNDEMSLTMRDDEKGCHLVLSDSCGDLDLSYHQLLLNALLLGESSKVSPFLKNAFEEESVNNFLNELSHSRRFWLKIEEILAN